MFSRCLLSANPAIAIGDAYVTDRDGGQTALVFHATLSQATSR
jgi:hypothetical protein